MRVGVARKLIIRIDEEPSKLNVQYEGKRASGRINLLVLNVVKPGEIDRYRKRQTEGGKNHSQFEILKLTTDARCADEFVAAMYYAAVVPAEATV